MLLEDFDYSALELPNPKKVHARDLWKAIQQAAEDSAEEAGFSICDIEEHFKNVFQEFYKRNSSLK